MFIKESEITISTTRREGKRTKTYLFTIKPASVNFDIQKRGDDNVAFIKIEDANGELLERIASLGGEG